MEVALCREREATMATAIRRSPNARPPGRARRLELLRLLGEQDQMLRTRKQALRIGVPAEMFGVVDEEERSLDDEELGVGTSVLELTSRTRREIETAIRRVEAGEYGTCSNCRSRITPERLKALPFADRCRRCQEEHDVAAPPARSQVGTTQERL
jgi:RNA polymerase-binding transcription factor DksA